MQIMRDSNGFLNCELLINRQVLTLHVHGVIPFSKRSNKKMGIMTKLLKDQSNMRNVLP
jgi:hypothetical protein